MAFACFAGDPVAARLARAARQAQNAGQLVRAYLLYAEAAARDPQNPEYRANRDALASPAQLLSKAKIETADISSDIKAAESASEPPLESGSLKLLQLDETLQPLPPLKPKRLNADFNVRGDVRLLFTQIAQTYGIRPIFDPDLNSAATLHFSISQADFRVAMEGLTAATHTFLFPISEHDIFVAADTLTKRATLEPNILLTIPLPNVVDPKELTEAVNAVRSALNMRAITYDFQARMVLVRDRVSRARIARSLLEALLLPKAQVSVEVELFTVDSERTYHYGLSLPTSYQLIDFGHIGGFKTILPTVANAMNFLAFGGGATLFGVGLTDATLFATYSKTFATNLYDATVVVSNGQTADLHVGDKYPIPQTLYTGFQQSGGSIYNPIGEVTLEDLGLVLKLTPRVNGDGDISLDVEAQYKTLGGQAIDSVPIINQREFKGNVRLREGECAIVAGIDENTHTLTRTGLPGLSQIPGLNQLFSENSRDDKIEQTLLVIKPTVTRLPMSSFISPEYLLGPRQGLRVVL